MVLGEIRPCQIQLKTCTYPDLSLILIFLSNYAKLIILKGSAWKSGSTLESPENMVKLGTVNSRKKETQGNRKTHGKPLRNSRNLRNLLGFVEGTPNPKTLCGTKNMSNPQGIPETD